MRGSNDAFKQQSFGDGGMAQSCASGGSIHIKPSHKGLMHKDLGKPANAPITQSDIAKEKASGDPAKVKRAVFAANAKKWHH